MSMNKASLQSPRQSVDLHGGVQGESDESRLGTRQGPEPGGPQTETCTGVGMSPKGNGKLMQDFKQESHDWICIFKDHSRL